MPSRYLLTDFCYVVQRHLGKIILIRAKIFFAFLSFPTWFDELTLGAQRRLIRDFAFYPRLSFRSSVPLVANSKENERSHDKTQNEQNDGSFNVELVEGSRMHLMWLRTEKLSSRAPT
jgi:hypothetical protein